MMVIIPLTAMVVVGTGIVKRSLKIKELKNRLQGYHDDSINSLLSSVSSKVI